MSPVRTPLFRLEDIRDAIVRIQSFSSGLTAETYVADDLRRYAIERCIEIVSEASRHVPTEMKQRFPEIPWKQVADIGNVLRHGYEQILPRVIWETITTDLAPLKRVILLLIAEIEGSADSRA